LEIGGNNMKKFRENMSVLFGVVFIMSMVAATGAIEADQYLLGGAMVISGIFTGILTIILQSNQ
tara:strand:+ start:421 stop:612 length:192 start_codon:yes stop_codon:yes gene_type:complete